MRIHTTARHCELAPEDRTFVEQRLEKLSRYTPDLLEAHLVLTAEEYRYSAEITARVKGREIVGREVANEARTAIAAAADRLEEQMRRLKDRRLDQRRGDRTRTSDAMGLEEGGGDALESGGASLED